MIVDKQSERDLDPHTVLEQDDGLLHRLEPEEGAFLRSFLVIIRPDTYRRYLRSIAPALRMGDSGFTDWFREHGYSYTFDVDDLPELLSKSVLVLTGRQDSWVGYRGACRIIGNYSRGTFVVLDRAGHALEMEQVDLFRAWWVSGWTALRSSTEP